MHQTDGPQRTAADDELAQLSLFAPLAAVATETTAVSPWHEPLPDEWSAPPSAIEVQLAPPPVVTASIAPPDGHTRRQTKDTLRNANAARHATFPSYRSVARAGQRRTGPEG